jgi:hypothetical protein
LLADTPDQKGFSQQANILGVLYDVIPKRPAAGAAQDGIDLIPGRRPTGC